MFRVASTWKASAFDGPTSYVFAEAKIKTDTGIVA